MSTSPLREENTAEQSSSGAGGSGHTCRNEALSHNHILNAPDLQLDCLDDDDDDDDDSDEEESGSSSLASRNIGANPTTVRDVNSSEEEQDPSTTNFLLGHASSMQRRRRHPFAGAGSRSSGSSRPKVPRLTQLQHRMTRYPYLPHASLHIRARYQSELQRRFLTFASEDNSGGNDTDADPSLVVPMLNVRGLLESRGIEARGIDSRVGMLLALIGSFSRGLRQEVIDQNSKISKYSVENIADEKEEDREKCTICLVTFESEVEVRTLQCKHLFHTTCVDRWLKSNGQCPVCRVQVNAQRAAQEPSGSG